MQLTSKQNPVDQVYTLILAGIESWIQAGEIVAQAIDEDPDFVDKLCDKYPDISPETVVRFELIGRRKLHPKTLLNDAPGMRRLRKLPFQLQEKYVTQPVNLIVKSSNGYEVLKVDVRNLTPDQSAQVFDSTGIRSEAAQRAWIEDKAATKIVLNVNADMPYRITGRKIVFMQPCTLSAGDLAQILAKINL